MLSLRNITIISVRRKFVKQFFGIAFFARFMSKMRDFAYFGTRNFMTVL